MNKRTIVALAAGLALFSFGSVAQAEDSTDENTRWGGFDQGQQGDALGGLERTAGKTINDVNVPDASPPQPVDTSNGSDSGSSTDSSSDN